MDKLNVVRGLKFCKEEAVNLIFPSGLYCTCCGNLIDKSRSYNLCDFCIRKIEWGNIKINDSVFKEALSCVSYGLYSKQLVTALKFKGKTYVARDIGKIMFDRVFTDTKISYEEIFNADYYVPIPIHRDKERERGFNQAEKIAKYFAMEVCQNKLGNPRVLEALVRIKKTNPQLKVSGKEREENLRGAFDISPWIREELNGKTIVVVDDVYTTGATAREAARILMRKNPKAIYFVSFATGNMDATVE